MTLASGGRRGGRRGVALGLTLVVAVLALAAAPRRALAAGSDDHEAAAEARRRFKHGTKLFDEAKFLEAAHEFEEGYAIAPRPGFLINIAHSYRRAGDLKNALRYYELFLRDEKDSPQRAEVSGYLKSIDDALADQSAADSPKEGPSIHEAPPPAAPVPVLAAPDTKPGDDGARIWSRRLPWLVAGVAIVVAGALGLILAFDRPASRGECGSLGCFDER